MATDKRKNPSTFIWSGEQADLEKIKNPLCIKAVCFPCLILLSSEMFCGKQGNGLNIQ